MSNWIQIARLALGICLFAGLERNLLGVDWVRAGVNSNQPMWGIRGGLLWAIPPGDFLPPGDPRGLIRIGYPAATNGDYQLVNFIAIEPIVNGQRGFSELEPSQLDHCRGKRLWAIGGTNESPGQPPDELVAGRLSHPAPGVEQLDVDIGVEPFENGARVSLTISQRSDAPDEIRLTVHKAPGSADLQYCVLTATMGNEERLRQLWLRGHFWQQHKIVNSRQLYPDYQGDGFAPHQYYPLKRLKRLPNGDVLVCATTDEDDPASVFPFPGTQNWHFRGPKVTQYWKQANDCVRKDLQCVVNGRYTYWQSQTPVPGGIAFENFELQERFYENQEFIFGITRKSPEQLTAK